jgi:hypothetical protein
MSYSVDELLDVSRLIGEANIQPQQASLAYEKLVREQMADPQSPLMNKFHPMRDAFMRRKNLLAQKAFNGDTRTPLELALEQGDELRREKEKLGRHGLSLRGSMFE